MPGFKGKVVDESGNPLWGAHIITLLPPKKGVTTDKNGNFSLVGRTEEAYEIGFIGFKSQSFRLGRTNESKTFVLKEDAFALDEVVVSPRTPDIVDTSGIPDIFNPILSDPDVLQIPKKPVASAPAKKRGILDLIKENPIIALAVGFAGAIGIGALLGTIKSANNEASK